MAQSSYIIYLLLHYFYKDLAKLLHLLAFAFIHKCSTELFFQNIISFKNL